MRHCLMCGRGMSPQSTHHLCDKCQRIQQGAAPQVAFTPNPPAGTPNAVEEARCPECDLLVTDHANGQRPDSIARVMRGCELTETQASQCHKADELWKREGWPAVLAAVRQDERECLNGLLREERKIVRAQAFTEVRRVVEECRCGIHDGAPTQTVQRAKDYNLGVDEVLAALDTLEGKDRSPKADIPPERARGCPTALGPYDWGYEPSEPLGPHNWEEQS